MLRKFPGIYCHVMPSERSSTPPIEAKPETPRKEAHVTVTIAGAEALGKPNNPKAANYARCKVLMLTIMVIARAMRMYRIVATDRDPRMAMGKSLLGFLACTKATFSMLQAGSRAVMCIDAL